MLNLDEIKEVSNRFHNRIWGLFEKRGLGVEVLDEGNKNRRPDFLVSTKDGSGHCFICEAKYVASADYVSGRHISLHDDALPEIGFFKYDQNRKVRDVFKGADDQRRCLIQDRPDLSGTPFVVAIAMDDFVTFDRIPRESFGIREISAFMSLEIDAEQIEEFKGWSPEEKKRYANGQKTKRKLLPGSVNIKFVLNPEAENKFKPDYFFNDPIVR